MLAIIPCYPVIFKRENDRKTNQTKQRLALQSKALVALSVISRRQHQKPSTTGSTT
jgi:hypothetical protein